MVPLRPEPRAQPKPWSAGLQPRADQGPRRPRRGAVLPQRHPHAPPTPSDRGCPGSISQMRKLRPEGWRVVPWSRPPAGKGPSWVARSPPNRAAQHPWQCLEHLQPTQPLPGPGDTHTAPCPPVTEERMGQKDTHPVSCVMTSDQASRASSLPVGWGLSKAPELCTRLGHAGGRQRHTR